MAIYVLAVVLVSLWPSTVNTEISRLQFHWIASRPDVWRPVDLHFCSQLRRGRIMSVYSSLSGIEIQMVMNARQGAVNDWTWSLMQIRLTVNVMDDTMMYSIRRLPQDTLFQGGYVFSSNNCEFALLHSSSSFWNVRFLDFISSSLHIPQLQLHLRFGSTDLDLRNFLHFKQPDIDVKKGYALVALPTFLDYHTVFVPRMRKYYTPTAFNCYVEACIEEKFSFLRKHTLNFCMETGGEFIGYDLSQANCYGLANSADRIDLVQVWIMFIAPCQHLFLSKNMYTTTNGTTDLNEKCTKNKRADTNFTYFKNCSTQSKFVQVRNQLLPENFATTNLGLLRAMVLDTNQKQILWIENEINDTITVRSLTNFYEDMDYTGSWEQQANIDPYVLSLSKHYYFSGAFLYPRFTFNATENYTTYIWAVPKEQNTLQGMLLKVEQYNPLKISEQVRADSNLQFNLIDF